MSIPPEYQTVVNFVCDPDNGAQPEKNTAMREYMQRPDVAAAFHQLLAKRDLSKFDPAKVPDSLPEKTKNLLKKYSALG
jgi:hypothetical protein